MSSKKIIYIGLSIYLLLFLSAIGSAAESQKEIIVLTEKEATETALKNNYDILSKKEEINAAQARLHQAYRAATITT